VSLLIKISEERFKSESKKPIFTPHKEANDLVVDINDYPHAYVIACIMDKQIKAERAWEIPYRIKQEIGSFEINDLANTPLEDYTNMFNEGGFHRFNDIMAKCAYDAIQKIVNDYDGNAANLWNDHPSSAQVVSRFLEFNGAGIKISTMAANILARELKVEFQDYYSIDISPDVHVKRVLHRMGYLPSNPSVDQTIYKARELNPTFPGIIDSTLFDIGREYCRPTNPNCTDCIINSECKKRIR